MSLVLQESDGALAPTATALTADILFEARRFARRSGVREWRHLLGDAESPDGVPPLPLGGTNEQADQVLAFLRRLQSACHRETEKHVRRVALYAEFLGRGIQMAEADVFTLRAGAQLHDIGKAAIPCRLLDKAGPFTPDERALMELHAEAGALFLDRFPSLPPGVADGARCHHERWDGKGYSRGLAGEAIPLAARIIAIADVYDALRQDRPYRPALPEAEARDHLRREAGHAFDPALTQTFLDLLAFRDRLLPEQEDEPCRRETEPSALTEVSQP